MPAVIIRDVYKKFKKHRRKGFLTLKSTFVEMLHHNHKKKNDTFWALRGVNFELKKGKMLGIIGRNGSGKSTLLKVVAGITKPTKGEVQVNGRLSALIELGGGFHPEISGRENIFINGIILGLSKKYLKEKMDEIIEFSGLGDFIDAPVRTYSSGMYIRLGFSIAVHVNPEILLIDEILAVGDAKFGHKCIDKIEEYKDQGKTILFVSHDLSSVERYCDSAIWLERGRKMVEGHPRKTIDTYLNYIEREEAELMAIEHERVKDNLDGAENSDEQLSEFDPEIARQNMKEKKRWGNKDVEITAVKLLDKEGKDNFVFNTGDPMSISLTYRTKKVIKNPIFGIGIYLPNGNCVYGSNTYLENIKIEELNNEGEIRCHISSLDLIESSYFLDVACHNREGLSYDYHFRLYSFAVRSRFHNELGFYRPQHKWLLADSSANFITLES